MGQRACILGLILLSLPGAYAQNEQGTPCLKSGRYDAATNSTVLVDCHGKIISQASVKSKESLQPQAAPAAQPPDLRVDPDVLKSFNDFEIWQNNYTKRIFDHQDVYTFFIFIVVNMLVLAGLYFAWIQFNATLHLSRHIQSVSVQGSASPTQKDIEIPKDKALSQESASTDVGSFSMQQLKIGPDGVAISSSFIGLIILGFSMGFYLMYLKYVYPIRSVGSEDPTTVNYSPSPSQIPNQH